MPGFDIGVTVNLSYATLRDLARDQLAGRDLEVAGDVVIRLDDLDLRPRDGRVEVAVDFAVTRLKRLPLKPQGRLTLIGDPHYDPERRELSIRRLVLGVETGHLLLRVVEKMLHGALVRRLAEALVFPLDGPLARAERLVTEKLSDVPLGDRGRLRCTVAALRPRDITPTDGGLEIQVDVEGRGEVRLEFG